MKPRDEHVRRLFAHIAPYYDRLNTLISLGLHHRWRRQAIAWLQARPGDLCLDAAAGTGAFARALRARDIPVVAVDMTFQMLAVARQRDPQLWAVGGDGRALPFADETFDRAIVGFAFRHLGEELPLFLAELCRVLKPGGRCVALELSQPTQPLWCRLTRLYIGAFVPLLGAFVHREAYAYLGESLQNYPDAEALRTLFLEAGFAECSYKMLLGGVAAIHLALKGS